MSEQSERAGGTDPKPETPEDRAGAAIEASRKVLKKELFDAIDLLRQVNRRLPLLRRFDAEIERLGGENGPDLLVRNMALFQLLHDSFDMLVIDLVSLRRKFIKPGGLFYALMDHFHAFRRFEPKDLPAETVVWVGDPVSALACTGVAERNSSKDGRSIAGDLPPPSVEIEVETE